MDPVQNSTSPAPYSQPDPPNSRIAIASLVLSILGIVTCFCGLVFGPLATVLGHLGLNQTRPGGRKGRELAMAGLIMGYIQIVFWVGIGISVSLSDGTQLNPIENWMDTRKKEVIRNSGIIRPEEAEIHLILPNEHNPSQPLPAAIWFHRGRGNLSAMKEREDYYQRVATDLGIAIIGMTAPLTAGTGEGEWMEMVEDDHHYVTEVLRLHESEVRIVPGRVVLFGLAQGARVAGELAGNYPEEFAGAIVISPTGYRKLDLSFGGNRDQHFVCVVGQFTFEDYRTTTQTFVDAFEKAGASVIHQITPKSPAHDFPPDFEARFPEWVRLILDLEPGGPDQP